MKLKNKINSLKGLFAYSDVFKVTLNFKTEEVTTMELMFMGCSSLTEVKFEEINTSKVIHLYRMFTSCSELTQLDLSSWDTTSVTEMILMFNGCTSLKYLNLINMNSKKITDSNNMLYFLYNVNNLEKCAYYEYREDLPGYFHKDSNTLLGFHYCGSCMDDSDIYCTKTIYVCDAFSIGSSSSPIEKKFYYVDEEKNFDKSQRSCYWLNSKSDESYISKEILGIYFKSKCDESCETCQKQ